MNYLCWYLQLLDYIAARNCDGVITAMDAVVKYFTLRVTMQSADTSRSECLALKIEEYR